MTPNQINWLITTISLVINVAIIIYTIYQLRKENEK